jgi:hypothetical protein
VKIFLCLGHIGSADEGSDPDRAINTDVSAERLLALDERLGEEALAIQQQQVEQEEYDWAPSAAPITSKSKS